MLRNAVQWPLVSIKYDVGSDPPETSHTLNRIYKAVDSISAYVLQALFSSVYVLTPTSLRFRLRDIHPITAMKVAIFPASGALGGSTTHHFLHFLPPTEIVLISRDPTKNASTGATTRAADYNDASTLTHAFDGVTCLFLVSYPSIEHEARFNRHKLAIGAAVQSGVQHIFYSSLAFAKADDDHSEAHVMQAHLDTEKYLADLAKEDKLTYTSIREGIYSESFPMYIGFPDLSKQVKEVRIPHDGQGCGVAWAKRDELGEASARLIQQYVEAPEKFQYSNKVVLLSGPRSWSLAETMRLVGEASGQKVLEISPCSVDEYVAQPQVKEVLASHGPYRGAEQWATMYDAVQRGETDVVSPMLRQLLGREPESFEITIEQLLKS